ncbi:hypothetical protein V3N99_07880 [Dermatophilaceae bacterium Soc4.6]
MTQADGVDDVPTVTLAGPQTRAAARAAREAAARGEVARPASEHPTGPGGSSDPAVAVTSVTTVGVTAALALLVGSSAASGPLMTGVAVGFVGLVLAWGWPRLLSAPTPRWSAAVVGAGSLALGLTVGLTRDEPMLRWLPATIGVSIVLAFLQQLLRRERSGLTLGLSSSVAGLALATVGAPLAALPAYSRGPGHVAVAMGAVAVAALADLLAHVPALRRWVLVPAAVAGVLGALLVARLVGVVDPVPAAVLGVVAGVVSHIVRRVLAPLPGAGSLPARLSQGAASVLVVGVLVYLITRLYVA